MIDQETIGLLMKGVNGVTWQSLVMIGVSFVLFYLAIVKDYEPLLLLPIGAGCLLANLPLSPLIAEDGMLKILYEMGVGNEMFPLLVFIGIGALTDFGPLLENPKFVLLGAAGQFGIFLTLILALLLGFTQKEAASIGIIGAIDGPTSIYVSGILAPHMLGPITVAAYSYMSLVPIIMPPVIYALTTKHERAIRMPYASRKLSTRTRIMFPIIVTVMVGILVPFATPLIGMLMLGNLMKESGAVERLTKASSNEIANTVTLFLGLAVGGTMVGTDFLKFSTLFILGLGLLAFGVDCAAGVIFAKILNVLTGGKVNPIIGAAGISAFPMAARVCQRVAQDEDFENFLLMHAMGANAAGQVASVVAGGVVLALMGAGG
ncbi:sodium ion-translocating decarboxylase subunit beta [Propionivibrio dicarboxylicus]|uniref:oxaloacetate decarboxylase (Na(+) extruding) n=1 Tax=Propionivibrio dicarboxylicus TaxID=83767 RepID=A0A1G8HKA6_9RHOO|nr:sodium ion-translocating decarboxylase subunit beta [Propionivibrio dicarboxylicus]SDI07025.1 oxaloacetate decarboxylase, beta subunit [Propionivibrio dicarboxylicus]SDI60231.1 oxaloacetate decarboxylase, beta subunit [Propionivibrio dicarboxylicus]